MPKRRTETTAAGLLATWTDSDTAMQIVGTSIGVFGDSLLDASLVLSKETPLRNALFDVLLSLVEGGTLDVRPTGDGHYAFRWRADFAVGALASETATTIDIEPPSPYLAELALARRERDAAVARAEAAEALVSDEPEEVAPPKVPAPAVPTREVEPESIDLVALEADEAITASDPEPADVVYLTPAAPEPIDAPDIDPAPASRDLRLSKWSAYSLEKPGSPLPSVERLAGRH